MRCAAAALVALAVANSAAQEPAQDACAAARDLLAAGLFEQAEVSAGNEVERLRAWHGDDALPVAAATDVLLRALILNGRGAHEQTIALARRTLRVKEAHFGSNHPSIATSLFNLGDLLAEAAEFEEAIAVTRRAIALRDESAPADGLAAAEALDHFGGALSASRRYDDALQALEQSLRLKEQALGENDVAIARTLEAIGLVLQRKGAYSRSGVVLRRAMAIQEAADANHPAYVRTLNLVAQQLWFEGDLIESRVASQRAVDLAERTLRPDHPAVAQALRYLGATLADVGDTRGSLLEKAGALEIADSKCRS